LFEIATDAPGFDIDEPLLELGRTLKLPPWLEPNRDQIAASLPVLKVDEATRAPVSAGPAPASAGDLSVAP
jgi:glyoxalase family protein